MTGHSVCTAFVLVKLYTTCGKLVISVYNVNVSDFESITSK